MKIAVLCGGISNERDVSITSGTGVARALALRGHKVVLIDLFLGYTEPFDDPNEVFERGRVSLNAAITDHAPTLNEILSLRSDSDCHIGPNVLTICRAADITFLAMHGDEGENGKLQATLDMHGIRYTGSGYLGSALAMNKGLSKQLFRAAGIGTAEAMILHPGDDISAVPIPCVIKPCSGGSSVGTAIVHTRSELLPALTDAFRYETSVLAERYVHGREFTVGEMDGKAMAVIEIIPKAGFYDYKNKYKAGATDEICPAEIPDSLRERLQNMAVSAAKTLMVDVYCRSDYIWDPDTDRIFCLEVNTLPGMTPTSLIPQMAAVEGMDYADLCERIIELSLRKYQA